MSGRLRVFEYDPVADLGLIKAAVKRLGERGAETGELKRHPVLTETALYVFWGARVWLLTDDTEPLSIHVSKIGKRKKNKWEPYMNWYGAYTLPDHRRRGHAYKLYAAAEKVAVSAGCRRVKSLAGSSAGLGLHLALKHQAWGRTPAGEVYIDSPLPFKGWEDLYDPKEQPAQAPGPRMSQAEISALIITGLRYDK